MENNYFIFYESFYDQISVLEDSDCGRFLKYIINYGLKGEEPKLNGIELAFWKSLKFALDSQKYRRATNRENIQKRWQKEEKSENNIEKNDFQSEFTLNTTEYDRIRPYTNEYESIPTDTNEEAVFSENTKSRIEMNRIEMNRKGEKEKEAESEFTFPQAVDNSEPVENSLPLSPSVSKNYSDAVFKIFNENNLPCCNGNDLSFYQRDFYQAYSVLKRNNYHSDEVIEACKNYASVVNDSSCYYRNKMNFSNFVRNKHFSEFLPENFVKENWVKYSETEKKDKEMKPAVSLMDRLKRPTVCQYCGGSMTIASETPDFCSVRCAECSSWAEYDFTNKKWDWEDRYNAAVS